MKFKKIICLLLILSALMSLCACSSSEADGRFIVSAIGADSDGKQLVLSVQTIEIGEGDFDEPPEVKVLSAKAKTPEEALKKLKAKSIKPLNFDHCAVMLCSSGLTAEQFFKMRDLCMQRKDINLAITVCVTDNCKKILEIEKSTGFSSGYDVAVLIESYMKQNGKKFKCKFYEIAKSEDIVLPYITYSDGTLCISAAAEIKTQRK